MRSCKCFPYVSKMSTLICNRANSITIKNTLIFNIVQCMHDIFNLRGTELVTCIILALLKRDYILYKAVVWHNSETRIYDFDIWFWSCSDSVVLIFFVFHFNIYFIVFCFDPPGWNPQCIPLTVSRLIITVPLMMRLIFIIKIIYQNQIAYVTFLSSVYTSLCSQRPLNHLAFQSFHNEATWWGLFQKRVMRTTW
jgi:hypothetical protein